MKSNNSREKWIQAGYFLFAENGPSNLSIQKLAAIASLPRTNFYYHFKDKDELIDNLIEVHCTITEEYLKVIREEIKYFLPDLHIISMRYPTSLKFFRQFFLNRHISKYNDLYISLNRMANPILIPKMLSYYDSSISYDIAEPLWMTVLDTWYSRLDVDNLSVEHLCEKTETIMKTVFDFSNR
ncbi:TetR/AcrR family transcriptional regulator [Lutimonas halocynthiae]|uniref:TetR/AcrR family transcriptional regulator n=1 Tax=Lutimonas halocynthiae TaxID=1446477 RepID=UPI0025B44294|nr:TetR/AcrR family transcriptional regulator [Lutimonas halocynthiae]MDN3643861.1 TetR/AcrR family transcriptional regulator [Lutimonas halocynthiae]